MTVVSSAVSTDERLIRSLRPVLEAAAPLPGEAVHAEALHQLCLADGLLELLDWSRQGLPADPLACMWLGSLRWHRLMTGRFPEGAPEPPPREADRLLGPAFAPGAPGRTALAEHSGSSSLAGLASGEMGHRSSPNQPEADDAAALLRVVPIGLVPYVEQERRADWAEQAASLTHGAASLQRRARRLAALFTRAASGRSAEQQAHDESSGDADGLHTELEEILQDADHLTATVLRRQLAAAARVAASDEQNPVYDSDLISTQTREPWTEAPTPQEATQSALRGAVDRLAEQWERVTDPQY